MIVTSVMEKADAAPLLDRRLLQSNTHRRRHDAQMLDLLDHQREIQEMLRDMPQILPPEGNLAAMIEVSPAPNSRARSFTPLLLEEGGIEPRSFGRSGSGDGRTRSGLAC